MDKKYDIQFNGETRVVIDKRRDQHILHRAIATKDIVGLDGTIVARAGDIGGWLESYDNLSQNGSCWVFRDAEIWDRAGLSEDAQAGTSSQAYDFVVTSIFGNAQLRDFVATSIFGNAQLRGNSRTHGCTHIGEDVVVEGETDIFGSDIFGSTRVGGRAVIKRCTLHNCLVRENAQIFDQRLVSKDICGDTKLGEDQRRPMERFLDETMLGGRSSGRVVPSMVVKKIGGRG